MKTMEEIYQELAAEFRQRTGLTAGGSGDLAVRFYAVAAQLYGLYAQAEWTEKQCFPQTAAGEALDYHAQLRSLSRRRAGKAAGVIRFFAAADRTGAAVIPKGTVCVTAEGLRYVTTGSGTIPVGETQLDLEAEAAEAGAAGNVAAGRILYLTLPPEGITACTNPEAFTGGCDDESDEALRQRVMASYTRLANGANAAFYEQAAASCEGVAAVKVLPRSRGVGTVDVIVAAHGGMPDQTLLDRVQAHLDGIREIAVDVRVTAPTEKAVDVSIKLTPEEGSAFAEVSQAVQKAVEGLFTGAMLGCPVPQAKLTAVVFAVEGVANCVVTITGGDVAAADTVLPCLGQLTVTEG